MRTIIARMAFLGALACAAGVTACSADVHDNTLDVHDNNANIENAKVDITSSSDSVAAGSMVHVDVKASDVFLCDPSTDPPADRAKVAGHLEFFIDSTTSASILTTAEESVDVPIPPTTPPGDHKLLCRVDKHDGTATQATSEIDIKVTASASVSGSVSTDTSSSSD